MESQREIKFVTTQSKNRLTEGKTCYQGLLRQGPDSARQPLVRPSGPPKGQSKPHPRPSPRKGRVGDHLAYALANVRKESDHH